MKIGFLILAACLLCGCVSTLDGQMKAGVPFAKDSMEGLYERTPAQILAAAREVIKRNGTLDTDNVIANTLHGKVDTRNVWIKVQEVDPRISRLTVQARTRVGSPDMSLASDIEKQIALQLATSR